MFISENSNQSRSYRVPILMIWIIAAVLILLLAGTIVSSVLFSNLKNSQEKISALMDENLVLLQENRKLHLLEENLKENTLLLKRVLSLVGIAPDQSGVQQDEAREQAIDEFVQNSEVLLQLSRPLTEDDIVDVIPSGMPSSGRITRGFNPEDENITRRHYGVDIVNKEGTKIYATADGMVRFAGYDDAMGKNIIIDHVGSSVGEGYETHYCHNLVNLVAEGEIVKKGDLIALSGNTGRSTGPHIHYEIRKDGKPVDPGKYLKNIQNYSIGN